MRGFTKSFDARGRGRIFYSVMMRHVSRAFRVTTRQCNTLFLYGSVWGSYAKKYGGSLAIP